MRDTWARRGEVRWGSETRQESHSVNGWPKSIYSHIITSHLAETLPVRMEIAIQINSFLWKTKESDETLLCIGVWVCVLVCLCAFVCIFMCICVRTCVHVCVRTWVRACIYMCMCVCVLLLLILLFILSLSQYIYQRWKQQKPLKIVTQAA